jgi:hypothetical protein
MCSRIAYRRRRIPGFSHVEPTGVVWLFLEDMHDGAVGHGFTGGPLTTN